MKCILVIIQPVKNELVVAQIELPVLPHDGEACLPAMFGAGLFPVSQAQVPDRVDLGNGL